MKEKKTQREIEIERKKERKKHYYNENKCLL